jgi:ATP-dependent protease ClpP protease subunit
MGSRGMRLWEGRSTGMNHNTPWRTTRGNRIVALAQGHNDWYKIKNLTDGPAQLSIYDEIGFFGITAHDLISDLADVAGPIDVHLNSPGGEVNDGLAIYNCRGHHQDRTNGPDDGAQCLHDGHR